MKTSFFIAALFMVSCNSKVPATGAASVNVDTVVPVVAKSVDGLSAPVCILHTIDSIKQDHRWNPPAEIHEYEYDGRKVYLISADCCDRFTTLVDADCNYICAPAGGFTGRGDGKCTDFLKHAKHIRLIWKDERAEK